MCVLQANFEKNVFVLYIWANRFIPSWSTPSWSTPIWSTPSWSTPFPFGLLLIKSCFNGNKFFKIFFDKNHFIF